MQSQSQYRYNIEFRDFSRDWNCAGIPKTFIINFIIPVLSFYFRYIYKSCEFRVFDDRNVLLCVVYIWYVYIICVVCMCNAYMLYI